MWCRIFLVILLLSPLLPAQKLPAGWKRLGKVEGLLGEDWLEKRTANTLSFARQSDVPYVAHVVAGLEESFRVNREFMGYAPDKLPLEFYFFPMEQGAHFHPKFAARLRNATRAAGVALRGTNICVVNLGNPRESQPYPPWQLEQIARHEMNHLFAFPRVGLEPAWGWWLEAMAEAAEDTVKPKKSQHTLASLKSFLKGTRAADVDFMQMVHERNNDQLEQYRDYEPLLVSIILYLQSQYGKDAVARVMAAAQVENRSLDKAFQSALGVSSSQLESGWRTFYGIR